MRNHPYIYALTINDRPIYIGKTRKIQKIVTNSTRISVMTIKCEDAIAKNTTQLGI